MFLFINVFFKFYTLIFFIFKNNILCTVIFFNKKLSFKDEIINDETLKKCEHYLQKKL